MSLTTGASRVGDPKGPSNASQLTTRTALPGADEVDGRLLWQAIDRINEMSTDSGLHPSLQMATYLLETFFEGSMREYRREGRRHATFRALLDHSALQTSGASLWYAIAVKEQYDTMPRQLADQLTLSHHRVLLPVRSAAARLQLARIAATENLSKRALERVRRRVCQREWQRGRGRPRIPELQKGLRALRKASEHLRAAEDQPMNATREDAVEAITVIEELTELLSEHHARLESWNEPGASSWLKGLGGQEGV